jgi:hypothetical protein
MKCGMAKAIIMCMHIQQETGENGCTTKVCVINRKQHVSEREESEFPVATDGGALSTAIGSYMMPWGCQAARHLR